MPERYHIGAYWSARREEVGECAQRAELFFGMLARCDTSLDRWYRGGRVARGSPGHPVRTDDRAELESLLLRERIRTDLHKRVMEDLGFGLEVWNREPDARSTRVSIRCGVYTQFSSNVCLLKLPSEGEAAERMLNPLIVAQMLTCIATAWDPDWGVVTSHPLLELLSPNEDEVHLGWMMYFARRWGTVPPLPAPVRIEPVGSLGMLVILTPERFTASNPEHIALGRRVRELLERAGLLRPVEVR